MVQPFSGSLSEGVGMGRVPFNRVLSKIQGCGRMLSAPTKALMILVFTIQRTTLPQSRPLGVPALSEREPGMAGSIQPGTR